ncbi:MAG TPA: hypothetical protein VKB93_27765 [Thermoanaerobaculia bacterium]|nr:hypothetical protein [Thermoanaerobaculia bacterium]
MKTILLAVALSAGLATAASAELHGSWTATLDEKRPDRMHVSIVRNGWNHFGNTMKTADFAGLTPAQISSSTQTPVQFKLTREAGTLTFEGTFKRGDGAGQYSFDANPGYIQSLRSLGVTFELPRDREKTEEQALFELALIDVSTAYIRTMQGEGYRESFATYKKMRLFNVTPEFIHQLADAGYSNLPADKLVKLKIHGVDIDYIRKMNSIQQER